MGKLEIVAGLREIQALQTGKFVLRAGEETDYYVNIKKALGYPELLGMMAAGLANVISPRTTCIAASGYGGLALGAALSLETELPMIMVRDTRRDHGTASTTEGYTPTDEDAVTLVDDVYTTGSSLRSTANVLAQNFSAEIVGGAVVVDRGDSSTFEYPIAYLLTPEDLTARIAK